MHEIPSEAGYTLYNKWTCWDQPFVLYKEVFVLNYALYMEVKNVLELKLVLHKEVFVLNYAYALYMEVKKCIRIGALKLVLHMEGGFCSYAK